MRKHSVLLFFASAILLGFVSCTSNPVGDDEIEQGNREMAGTVRLSDGADPEGVFVWLEGIDISTRTDANGNFQLVLPPPSGQNSSGGLDGLFQAYFYSANYVLGTVEVLLREGQFVYGSADLNNEGNLLSPLTLDKFLVVETIVNPEVIPVPADVRIGVTVSVRSLGDSVTVRFPRSIGDLLGAVYMRNIQTGDLFIIKGPPTNLVDEVLVDRQGHTRALIFDLNVNPLPRGDYEVIPYLLVNHEPIPAELLAALGFNIEAIAEPLPDYLRIPFTRDLAVLSIEF